MNTRSMFFIMMIFSMSLALVGCGSDSQSNGTVTSTSDSGTESSSSTTLSLDSGSQYFSKMLSMPAEGYAAYDIDEAVMVEYENEVVTGSNWFGSYYTQTWQESDEDYTAINLAATSTSRLSSAILEVPNFQVTSGSSLEITSVVLELPASLNRGNPPIYQLKVVAEETLSNGNIIDHLFIRQIDTAYPRAANPVRTYNVRYYNNVPLEGGIQTSVRFSFDSLYDNYFNFSFSL